MLSRARGVAGDRCETSRNGPSLERAIVYAPLSPKCGEAPSSARARLHHHFLSPPSPHRPISSSHYHVQLVNSTNPLRTINTDQTGTRASGLPSSSEQHLLFAAEKESHRNSICDHGQVSNPEPHVRLLLSDCYARILPSISEPLQHSCHQHRCH